jgi:hypothetical protein
MKIMTVNMGGLGESPKNLSLRIFVLHDHPNSFLYRRPWKIVNPSFFSLINSFRDGFPLIWILMALWVHRLCSKTAFISVCFSCSIILSLSTLKICSFSLRLITILAIFGGVSTTLLSSNSSSLLWELSPYSWCVTILSLIPLSGKPLDWLSVDNQQFLLVDYPQFYE